MMNALICSFPGPQNPTCLVVLCMLLMGVEGTLESTPGFLCSGDPTLRRPGC